MRLELEGGRKTVEKPRPLLQMRQNSTVRELGGRAGHKRKGREGPFEKAQLELRREGCGER